MAKAKPVEKEVVVKKVQQGKVRDSFSRQNLAMKMFAAKLQRQKALSKPEEV